MTTAETATAETVARSLYIAGWTYVWKGHNTLTDFDGNMVHLYNTDPDDISTVRVEFENNTHHVVEAINLAGSTNRIVTIIKAMTTR
jgi:hypothetical protein